MKKLIFSLVAALCCSASMCADDLPEELVATLNHEGTLSAYYGTTAFVEAMENADNGDEITLTGGTFDGPTYGYTYEKVVTIRGAGVKEVIANKTKATEIGSSFTFNIPVDTDEELFIEGVRLGSVTVKCSEQKEAIISKCTLSSVKCDGSLLIVINCEVGEALSGYPADTGYAYFKNSVIYGTSTASSFHCTYDHCVYNGNRANPISANNISHSVFRHCIIFNYDDLHPLPYTVQLINCILPDFKTTYYGEPYYGKAQMESCYILDGIVDSGAMLEHLFGTRNNFAHLTDEAKALYPGTDGTEIGIYGGDYPFSYDITLPFVTKLVIGDRTANGKLPVTIEVK